jgi:hypothetical protein
MDLPTKLNPILVLMLDYKLSCQLRKEGDTTHIYRYLVKRHKRDFDYELG